MVFVLALIILYTRNAVGKAYDNGERYEAGAYQAPVMHDADERPAFLLAILPLIAVFICNTILPLQLAFLCSCICVSPSVMQWQSSASSPIW